MRKLLYLLLATFALFANAEAGLPLPAEKAFGFSAHMETPNTVVAEWEIEPGYYLYRDKVKIQADEAKSIGQIVKPEAKKIYLSGDSVLTPHSIWGYQNALHISIPLKKAHHQALTLVVKYQGCAQDGFCYAPETRHLELSFPFSKAGLNNTPLLMVSDNKAPTHAHNDGNLLTSQAESRDLFSNHIFIVTLLCFLGLGVLLAFTPCSLPMIPILSSIIVGQRNLGGRKAFYLSLSYVLGVAVTYAMAGIAIAWLGASIQSYFQNPWLLSAFALLFVLLAFSLLGYFELRLPSGLQQKLGALQHQQKGGTVLGVFLMGCLSSLLVSPCVTAPLVGVLAYVSESGNLWLGGAALFCLGLGMGLPLLVIGFSAGQYLPKAGPWMVLINRFFAFLLLGMAVYLLSRFLPGGLSLFLWAFLLITAGITSFFSLEQLSTCWRYASYGLSGLLVAYGMVLFMGVALSYTSPFYPFEKHYNAAEMNFVQVKDMQQLNEALKEAKAANKPALIDFYAEWCESCRAVEEKVLSKTEVQAALQRFVFIRANVTENNSFDRALLKRYNVIAPPTFLFFNRQGQEEKEQRIVGEVGHQLFLAHANTL